MYNTKIGYRIQLPPPQVPLKECLDKGISLLEENRGDNIHKVHFWYIWGSQNDNYNYRIEGHSSDVYTDNILRIY